MQISSDYYLKSQLHKIRNWHSGIKKYTEHRILGSFLTDLRQYHQVHKYFFVREISLQEPANTTWHVQPAGHGDFHVSALQSADLLWRTTETTQQCCTRTPFCYVEWTRVAAAPTSSAHKLLPLCCDLLAWDSSLETQTTQRRPCQFTTIVRLPSANVPADCPPSVGVIVTKYGIYFLTF